AGCARARTYRILGPGSRWWLGPGRSPRPAAGASQARPSARAASAVTGAITSGSTRASPSAVAVSFRPLPVTVHTTVAPAGRSPASARASRPATLAADAGSTNTPTLRATNA